METKPIVVNVEDDEKMMNECIAILIRSRPEYKNVHITRRMMFSKLVEFYMQ